MVLQQKENSDERMDQKMLYLPETMIRWPWPRAINPHYEEVSAQSNAWFHGHEAFTKRSQEAFDKCDFGRLASLAYPTVSKEHLRTGCDLMNLFFVVDEYTDVEPAHVVREMVDIVIDALKNPHKSRPQGEILLGQVAKEFWELALKTATPSSAKHFVEAFTDYLESVVVQAQDRDSDKIRTIDEYLETRRQNIGARPSYVPGELHLDLPDEAFYHPVIKEMEYLIADLIILDNDLASYNKEQANGDDRHNILTIVMHQLKVELEGAIAWVYKYHAEVENKFIALLGKVPSFSPKVDEDLRVYILHLANWPRCNDCWNFESGRYFGKKGREIQRTRWVPMLSKFNADPSLKRDQVFVPLIPH